MSQVTGPHKNRFHRGLGRQVASPALSASVSSEYFSVEFWAIPAFSRGIILKYFESGGGRVGARQEGSQPSAKHVAEFPKITCFLIYWASHAAICVLERTHPLALGSLPLQARVLPPNNASPSPVAANKDTARIIDATETDRTRSQTRSGMGIAPGELRMAPRKIRCLTGIRAWQRKFAQTTGPYVRIGRAQRRPYCPPGDNTNANPSRRVPWHTRAWRRSVIVLPGLGSEPLPNLNRTRTEPKIRFEDFGFLRTYSNRFEPVRPSCF